METIKQLVKETPNDLELGRKIREYVLNLKDTKSIVLDISDDFYTNRAKYYAKLVKINSQNEQY
jgi:hypothetical protein